MSTFNFDALMDHTAIKRQREENQQRARKRRNVIESKEIVQHHNMTEHRRTQLAQSTAVVYMYGRYHVRTDLPKAVTKKVPADLTVRKRLGELVQSKKFRWPTVLVGTTYVNSHRVDISALVRMVNVLSYFRDETRTVADAEAKSAAFVAQTRKGFHHWVTEQHLREGFAAYADPKNHDVRPQVWTTLPNIWLWEERLRNPESPDVQAVIDRMLYFRNLPTASSQFEQLMYLPGLSVDDYEDARRSFQGWSIYGSPTPDPQVIRYLATRPGFVDASRCIFENLGDVTKSRLSNAPDVTDYVSNNLRQVVASKEYKTSNYPVKIRVPENNPDSWELMVYNGNGNQIGRRRFQAGMTYIAGRFDQIQKNQQDMKRNQEAMRNQIDRMEQMMTTMSQTRPTTRSRTEVPGPAAANEGKLALEEQPTAQPCGHPVVAKYTYATYGSDLWVPLVYSCIDRSRFSTLRGFKTTLQRNRVKKLSCKTVPKDIWNSMCSTLQCKKSVRVMYSVTDICQKIYSGE